MSSRHLTPLPPPDESEPTGATPPHDDAAERAVLGAMLTGREACSIVTTILTGADFYSPAHELIFEAAQALYARLEPVDTITVADRLIRDGQLQRAGGHSTLASLVADAYAVPAGAAEHHARIVADRAARRRIILAGQRIASLGWTPSQAPLEELLAGAVAEAERARVSIPGVEEAAVGETIDDLLAGDDDDEPDWLVPGVLERQDRLIVTAAEGAGKSTLLRQWAVQFAAGIHPFTGAPMDPLRVLILDLENSRRQTRRKLRPMRLAAPDLNPDNLVVVCKPDGLDLTSTVDQAWLDQLVAQRRPDIILGGPIYKMAAGNPNDEVDAKPAAMAIDALRERHDVAVILEAHQKKSVDGKASSRAKEPFGWSGWMRWPEFGIHLAEDGTITHWRGMRDEREFPEALTRGGKWPWSPTQSPNEGNWERIRQAVWDSGRMLSLREIQVATNIPKSTVERLIKGPFQTQWRYLCHEVGGEE